MGGGRKSGRMRKGLSSIVVATALLFVTPSSGAPPAEPRNLDLLKHEIDDYIDSGRYWDEIAAVAKEANAYLERRTKQGGGRLTIVFDIDETMLSNLPHIRSLGYGYQSAAWLAWVAKAEAPVIGPMREVFRTARRLGIEVIFLTGRRERDRLATEKNLKAAGVGDYAGLFFMPTESNDKDGRFKTAARQRLVGEGYVIIANIGDQDSDLEGGFAERTFKLPDPFYL